MNAYEFATKLINLPTVSNLPIRFSADNPYDSSAETIEYEFAAINIDEKYVEIELKRFDPHKEMIAYFERAIKALYFPTELSLKVRWDADDQCYELALRPSLSEGIHPRWVCKGLDADYGFWVWQRADTIGLKVESLVFTVPDPNISPL